MTIGGWVLEVDDDAYRSFPEGSPQYAFATSLHDRRSPPYMNMWYNSGCAAGPEVACDTSAPSLSTSRTRSPCRHRQLSPVRTHVSI
jgi:hypothetical protein